MSSSRSRHGKQVNAWLEREWLVTNGLGGYAFGTVAGVPTRAQHAPLVAALPGGREIVVAHLAEQLDGTNLGALCVGKDDFHPTEPHLADAFEVELGLPVWRFRVGGVELEKRLSMVHGENVTVVTYRADAPAKLVVLLWLGRRGHVEAPERTRFPGWTLRDEAIVVGQDELTVIAEGGALSPEVARGLQIELPIEKARGYSHRTRLDGLARATFQLEPGRPVHLVIAAQPLERARRLDPGAALLVEQARRHLLLTRTPLAESDPLAARLVLAADAFIARITREGRPAHTVMAGYPWFTDWGRDTFIALEGLTLSTRRPELAQEILRAFVSHVRDGLVPNLFPEGGREGLYNTADATLWLFHALSRYVERTQDRALVDELLPTLREIIAAHRRGTRFGIGVDPHDGLLHQGAPELQLTWMDAKVDGHVVTPRRGKTVEINALWYQALRLMAAWTGDAELAREAERVQASFNRRFWRPKHGYLFDVVDGEHGDDASVRPNQLFAISLPHPVLAREHWRPVLDLVRDRMLIRRGVRTLAPGDPRYRGLHAGDVHRRDAAYHNGTAWPWLLGAWVDARLALDPHDKQAIRAELDGILATLDDGCVGQLAEIFSGNEPHAPEGCPAQAWSVAEVLRALEKLG